MEPILISCIAIGAMTHPDGLTLYNYLCATDNAQAPASYVEGYLLPQTAVAEGQEKVIVYERPSDSDIPLYVITE